MIEKLRPEKGLNIDNAAYYLRTIESKLNFKERDTGYIWINS